MKRISLKRNLLSGFVSLILILNSSINIFANDENLYEAYTKNSVIRVRDGKDKYGNDSIAYCYDRESRYPGNTDGNEDEKTYYTKIQSYLESNDILTEKYGKEKKQRIAAVLLAGYPIDAHRLLIKSKLNEKDAVYMTQMLIWDIIESRDGELSEQGSITYDMASYYNELLKHSKIQKFEQDKLDLHGKLEFIHRGDSWSTDKLYATGSVGSFSFEDLPTNMEVRDFNTDIPLDNIKTGQEFYIISNEKPNDNLKLKIKYKYQEVELYFYKYHSGGIDAPSKTYQNLVRGELTNNIKEISFEIKINGNFEKPDIPESGGSNNNSPGDEGSNNPLPGEGDEGSNNPLPGEGDEAPKPDVPGSGGSNNNSPGDEGSNNPLPGEGDEAPKPDVPESGGSNNNSPGDEGSNNPLPGEGGEAPKPDVPGSGGSNPDLPGDEGSTDPLPGEGDEAPKPNVPGLGGSNTNSPSEESPKPSPNESNKTEISDNNTSNLNPKTSDNGLINLIVLGLLSLFLLLRINKNPLFFK